MLPRDKNQSCNSEGLGTRGFASGGENGEGTWPWPHSQVFAEFTTRWQQSL